MPVTTKACSVENSLAQSSAFTCTLYMPVCMAVYVGLVAPAMAVPFKNHWLPVVALEVSKGVEVLMFEALTVAFAGLTQNVWLTEGAEL